MPKRKIVQIDEEKCTGCGICIPSCAEGAIGIVDGKAKLLADNLCDGLGACLGECPVGAISIEEREASEFDEKEVAKHSPHPASHFHEGGACPSAKVLQFEKNLSVSSDFSPSQLRQWPVQLHLVSPIAPYYKEASVLLSADCVAHSLGGFHERFLRDHALAISCPKLDEGQEEYLKKLISMIDQGGVKSFTVAIMEVPCCGGLLKMAQEAILRAQRKVPLRLVRVGMQGEILEDRQV